MNAKKIFGWFIILIMILGGLGIVFQDDGSFEYNGIKFIQQQNGWQAKINGKILEFYYFPENLEQIELPAGTDTLKNAKALIVSYNPNSMLAPAFAQLQFDFEQKLDDTYVIRGITNGTALPIYSCNNATPFTPVIQFEEFENNSIELLNNCLVIRAFDGYNFGIRAERALYSLLGVMEWSNPQKN